MEGLGAASGCIAVISLAIQVGDSAYKIHDFFDAVKNAPSDVIRLRHGINRLRMILKELQNLLEQQNARRHAPPPSLALCDALETCRKTLSDLEAQVGRLKSRLGHKGLDKVWNSLKVPIDNDKILEAQAEVESAIATLQLAMQMNSAQLSFAHMDRTECLIAYTEAQVASTKTSQLVHVETFQAPSHCSRSSGSTVLTSQEFHRRTFLGTYVSSTVCRRLKIDENAKDESERPQPLIYETTTRFIPSFGYRAIIWNVRTIYGSIERSLRTVIVDDASELWNLCHRGDTELFKQAISQGANPFVIDETGQNLYHAACNSKSLGIVRLLIQLSVPIDNDVHGYHPSEDLLGFRATTSTTDIEILELMAAKEGGFITIIDICNNHGALFVYSTESMDMMLLMYRNGIRCAPNYLAIEDKARFILGWADYVGDWSAENLVAMLRRFRRSLSEADLDLTDPRFLHRVFGEHFSYNSRFRFQIWLRVLEILEQDTATYLDRIEAWLEKSPGLQDNGFQDSDELWRFRQLHVDKISRSVSWEWLFDPEEPALELCQTFQDLLVQRRAFDVLAFAAFDGPLQEEYICPLRCPRRIRKMAKRERLKIARLEQKTGSRRLPGTFEHNEFGIDDDWYINRCVSHLKLQHDWQGHENGRLVNFYGCMFCYVKRFKHG